MTSTINKIYVNDKETPHWIENNKTIWIKTDLKVGVNYVKVYTTPNTQNNPNNTPDNIFEYYIEKPRKLDGEIKRENITIELVGEISGCESYFRIEFFNGCSHVYYGVDLDCYLNLDKFRLICSVFNNSVTFIIMDEHGIVIDEYSYTIENNHNFYISFKGIDIDYVFKRRCHYNNEYCVPSRVLEIHDDYYIVEIMAEQPMTIQIPIPLIK